MASIITHDPAVNECLKQKIVNYHALAAKIKPEVERLAGKPASVNTIVVAITRFSGTISGASRPRPLDILKGARITLVSDTVDVTISVKKSELFPIVKRIAELSPDLAEPIHIFQLSSSIKLIADEGEYNSLIRSSLDKIQIVRETTKLSRLNIRLSPAVETTPEFGLFLTELLYRDGIKIRHTYIGEETILILGRDEGPRAYEILRREIDRSKEALVEQ
ncbi:MAG: hypothetical protein JRN39_00310 [Nitrososphaerota archaeon]|nr:hypothetical protein [Nitrososphaerota archaeon]MDG6938838.1 hypothetical protein [Nitrososphaerota archaeon]